MAAPAEDQQVAVIAALCYLFPPIVSLVALSGGEGKRPVLERHARQALYWTPAFFVLLALTVIAIILLMRVDFLMICLVPFLLLVPFIPGGIWARTAYLGRPVTIRLLTPLAERKMAAE